MANLLSTGLSGLLAFQRGMDTTGHNISNVNTVGYSRQRTDFVTRDAEPMANGWVGRGTMVDTVRRVYDDFVALQVRATSSSLERLDAFSTQAERLNNMFGNTTTGLTASLQKFVNAFQGVANAPTSIPARQVLLSEAQGLRDRLASYESNLNAMDAEINQRISGEVAEINSIAQAIAKLNADIVDGQARTGQPPNDLMDQRDKLLDELASKVSVNVVRQDGGAANVFVGNGQVLVLGSDASQLTTVQDQFDAARLGVGVKTTGGTVDVTDAMTGGSLGGLLDFRREQLDPAHNTLGRVAAGLADVVNEQHRAGMDLNGALGTDFFSVGNTQVQSSRSNTGTGTVSVARSDVGGLTDKDYVLENTAGGWVLRDSLTGSAVTMTGSGTNASPFMADGLSIVVGGTAAVGDKFQLRPTRGVIGGFDVLVKKPEAVAAAAPIRTAKSNANTGTGAISAGTVLDSTDANLQSTVTIRFTSATTYSVNGAGSFTYTPGANIDINGWRVQISGTPATNDQFTVQSNAGGVGDNRNALALADALQSPVLNGGKTSLTETVGSFVSGIGVATRQAQVNRDAQRAVFEEASAARDGISGVNLDEEAANLMRLQQAYQAAAQVIRVADTLFQTLLQATSR